MSVKVTDYPIVRHKTPCKECPFRRVAPAGWLGGGIAQEWYLDIVLGDTMFGCHMSAQREKNVFCAGSMIHYNNQFKTPRDPKFAELVKKYGRDTETVFQWASEFKEHHEKGPLAEKTKEIKERRNAKT